MYDHYSLSPAPSPVSGSSELVAVTYILQSAAPDIRYCFWEVQLGNFHVLFVFCPETGFGVAAKGNTTLGSRSGWCKSVRWKRRLVPDWWVDSVSSMSEAHTSLIIHDWSVLKNLE